MPTQIALDPPDENRYRTALLESAPAGFFSALIRAFQIQYRNSHEHVRGLYRKPEAHDALGTDRRSRLEEATRAVAERFGISCPAVMNRMNSSYHRELRMGSVILTQSCSHDGDVRGAVFRKKLAEQYNMFSITEEIDIEFEALMAEDECAYGIIIHGPHSDDPGQLLYMNVVFPHAEQDRYITRVNLLSEFSVVVPSTVPDEEIAKEVAIKPRRIRKDLEG